MQRNFDGVFGAEIIDPAGQPLAGVRVIRDAVERWVRTLLAELEVPTPW